MRMRFRHGGTVFVTALFLFIVVLSLFVGVFERSGNATVSLAYTYHFLVRSCDAATSAAVAGESYLAGGAGYLMEKEGLVVLAGYYRKDDATYLQGTMSERGVEVSVLSKTLDDFSTKRSHSDERGRVEGNLKTLDSLSRLLFDAANGLERGTLSQEEAHAVLQGVLGSLEGMLSANEGEYFRLWNVGLLRIGRRAREADAGLLFARDMRYLQVWMLFTILDAPAYFS